MNLSRRGLLAAAAAASAVTLGAPKAFAVARSSPRPDLLMRAVCALQANARSIPHSDRIGIVDFAALSCTPRFQLVDIPSGTVLNTLLVSHGRGSDPANRGWVERFSNVPGSNASSSGSFVTGSVYVGRHGRSRRLIGLDPENSLAAERAIVIHAASYVNTAMALTQGRVGRSQGCFAVSDADIACVLARLGEGRLLFAMK